LPHFKRSKYWRNELSSVIRQRAANSSHCCIIHAANSARIAYWGGVLCSDKILAQRSFRPAQIFQSFWHSGHCGFPSFRILACSSFPDRFDHFLDVLVCVTEAIEKGKRIVVPEFTLLY
jgi:hypothetical protein